MARIPTVEELRKAGFKARVTHSRLTSAHSEPTPIQEIRNLFVDENGKVDNEQLNWFLNPNGGETLVEIRTPEGIEITGKAVCSKGDPFNKKLGRALAIVRALDIKPETKFKVGDSVFFIQFAPDDNSINWNWKIMEKKVLSIPVQVNINQEADEITFGFGWSGTSPEPIYFVEDYGGYNERSLYASKQELIDSL